MAGDWIQWTKGLAKKREVLILAARFARDRHEIAGRLMELWEWCDDNIPQKSFDEDGNVSLFLGDNCPAFIDAEIGLPGFAEAMAADDIGWLKFLPRGEVVFVNLGRHNGSTAKTRGLEARKKARQRAAAKKLPDDVPISAGLEERREERREENYQSSKGERLRGASSNGENRSGRSSPPSHSPRVALEGEEEPPLDLSEVVWDHVFVMAEKVAKSIPPLSDEDRRAWLRYAILAERNFGEGWLIDAVQAVLNAPQRRKSPQAHFVGVLQSKAAEVHGTDRETLAALTRRIEIPTHVWKGPILRVSKRGAR
jgi:hypothetical protein